MPNLLQPHDNFHIRENLVQINMILILDHKILIEIVYYFENVWKLLYYFPGYCIIPASCFIHDVWTMEKH